MTTPVSHGYPDWRQYVGQTDIEVYTDAVVVGAATVIHGRFFVGTSQYLQILYQNASGAGGARLTLSWYKAATGAALIGTQTIDVRLGLFATGTMACLGPYVELSSIADAAGRNIIIRVWQANNPGQENFTLINGSMIAQDFTLIPNGVTQNYLANCVKWGWGYWNAQVHGAAAWDAKLRAIDYLGVATLMDFIPANTAQPVHTIHLPARPLQIDITNSDAVNRNVFCVLSAHVGNI